VKRLAFFGLRDRDAILTSDNLIFRVYGYVHPPNSYICDPEYAPASIFRSKEPKAYRAKGRQVYYKFFADEGLRFVMEKCPRYMVWHASLHRNMVGVAHDHIARTKQPSETLRSLLRKRPKDLLVQALTSLLDLVNQRSGPHESDFGVFGSLLHGFYHPMFSDLDLIIYGRTQLGSLRESLQELYDEADMTVRNEFESIEAVQEKRWKFRNYHPKDYVWHQRRKLIYALFHHRKSGRTIKCEFEPVKRWEEIQEKYDPQMQIQQKGWIKLKARVTDESDAAFMPSIYGIEPMEILNGKGIDSIRRVVSYVEEFRLQAYRDEMVRVEGNLEKVNTSRETFNQVVLTYCPRYYEQTLKVL